MSNCYTQFAFVVPMSDAVAVEAAEILEDLDPDSGSEDYAGTPFADLCDRLKELDEGGASLLSGLTIKPCAGGLLVASEGEGSHETAAAVVQALLNYYDLPDPVTFEVAHYTDRLLIDGCGGRAVLVTKSEITIESTRDLLDGMLAALASAHRMLKDLDDQA